MARYLFPGDSIFLPDASPATNFTFTWYDARQGGNLITDVLDVDGVSAAVMMTDSTGNRQAMYGPDGVEVMWCDTGASIRYPVTGIDREATVLDQAALLNVEQHYTATQYFDGGLQVPDGALTITDVAELENRLAAAAAEGELAQTEVRTLAVRSVNSVGPDANGNVVVAGGGGGGAVSSVAGRTGAVTLTPADVSLGNVNNTSDANKAISTLTQTALDAKAPDTEISTVNISAIAGTVRGLISGRRLYEGVLAILILFGYRIELHYNGTTWPALSTVPAAYIATGAYLKWNSEDYAGVTAPSEARDGDRWIKQA